MSNTMLRVHWRRSLHVLLSLVSVRLLLEMTNLLNHPNPRKNNQTPKTTSQKHKPQKHPQKTTPQTPKTPKPHSKTHTHTTKTKTQKLPKPPNPQTQKLKSRGIVVFCCVLLHYLLTIRRFACFVLFCCVFCCVYLVMCRAWLVPDSCPTHTRLIQAVTGYDAIPTLGALGDSFSRSEMRTIATANGEPKQRNIFNTRNVTSFFC